MNLTQRGLDIIRRMKAAHPELDDNANIGVVSSFCKGVTVKAAEGTSPAEIVGTLTTDDLDLEGERVLPGGVDVNSYLLKNRNVFVDHQYDIQCCVGKIRSMAQRGNGWVVRVAMLNQPENPYVRAVMALAEAGSCPMSIGFELVEGGPPTAEELKKYPGTEFLIRKSRAIEASWTAMPANVACQSDGVTWGDEEKSARSREILTKARIPERVIDSMVPRSQPRRVVVWAGVS